MLLECDILYVMLERRVGKFTKEEFWEGYNNYKAHFKPFISIFFKLFSLDNTAPQKEWDDATSVRAFHEEVSILDENQYVVKYESVDQLKTRVLEQVTHDIEKLSSRPKTNSVKSSPSQSNHQNKIKLKENSSLAQRDSNFVGRQNEIKYILDILQDKKVCSITGVVGNGGLGKSAVTNEIVHIVLDSWEDNSTHLNQKLFKDGVLWIKLEKEQTLEQVIEEQIIEQLGVKLSLSHFRRSLNKLIHNKDILVVLDSAEQNEGITYALIDIFSSFSILLTSRKRLDDVYEITLNTLDKRDSFELYEKHFGKTVLTGDRSEVISFCIDRLGGLPLIIKIIANYMRKTNRKLSDVQNKLNLLEISMRDSFRKEDISTMAVFEFSYSTLSDEAKKVFSIGGVFLYPFKEEYLLELIKRDSDKTTIIHEIDEMVEISLLEKNKEGLYTYHPLLREYALLKLSKFADSTEIDQAKKEYFATLSSTPKNLVNIYPELFFILDEDYDDHNFKRFFKIVKNLNWWLQSHGFYDRRHGLLKRAYLKGEELDDKENTYQFLTS